MAWPCSSGKLRGSFGNLKGAPIATEMWARGDSWVATVLELIQHEADSVVVRDSGKPDSV